MSNIKSMGFKNERIERFLFERVAEESWPVETAKSRLTEIMRKAQGGETQVVGKRKPVFLISVAELERMLVGFSQPESWGERFFPAISKNGLGGDLELPTRTRRVKDSYAIDDDIDELDTKEMQG